MSRQDAVDVTYKYKLPEEITDFNVNSEFYSGSDLQKTLEKVIKAVVTASKNNKKILRAIEYGIEAINKFINHVINYYQNVDKTELNYKQLKNLLKKTNYIDRTGSKKKKMGFVYNPFYFIMIFQLLKKMGKINDEEDMRILDDKSDPLNFVVDESGAASSSGGNSFVENSWKLMLSLLQMLYGKVDDAKLETKEKMGSIIQYLYPLYLEVAQLAHSIDDVALLPDCIFFILNSQNSEFLTKLFGACPSKGSSSSSNPSAYGPPQYGRMYGGSRTKRKQAKPCDTFSGNLSTMTQLLQGKQPNLVCQIINLNYKKFVESNLNNESADTETHINPQGHTGVTKNTFAKILSDRIVYKEESGGQENDEDEETTSMRPCDYSKFYEKLYHLYLIIAKDIIDKLKTNITTTRGSNESTNTYSKYDKVMSNIGNIPFAELSI